MIKVAKNSALVIEIEVEKKYTFRNGFVNKGNFPSLAGFSTLFTVALNHKESAKQHLRRGR